MKRFLTTLTGIAALVALLGQPSFAQDKEKDKDKDKDKVKTKNEEIIIHRKSDKDTKLTIEIKGDEVLVNGKPVDEYEDENISVTKHKGYTVISPFRSQSGSWSFNGNEFGVGEDIAFLGVVTDDHEKGVKIESVTDESAADKGGLKEGDIITKIDESNITSPTELTRAIRKHKPADKATITYLRDGKEQKATVTLGKRKMMAEAFTAPRLNVNPNFDLNWDNNGSGRSYSFSSRGRLGVKAQDTEDGKGVKVIGIDNESIAEKAGLKEGDIITEFDGKAVNDTDALAKAAREAREKASVSVKYNRDGKAQSAELKTPKKLKTTNL